MMTMAGDNDYLEIVMQMKMIIAMAMLMMMAMTTKGKVWLV